MAELEEHWQERYRAGLELLNANAPDLAILQLRLALELAPAEAELHAALLQSLLLSGQIDEALSHVQTQLKNIYISPELFYWCGMVMENVNNHTKAQVYYQKSLRISSQFAPAYLQMARIYVEQGLSRQALGYYQKYISLKPQDWEANLELAELLSENKYYDEANTLYQEIYIHHPQRTDILLKWIQNQVVLNPSQIVQTLIDLALQYPHLKSTLALHAASILKATGEIPEAKKSLEIALQDPTIPDFEAHRIQKEFLFCPIAESTQAIQQYADQLMIALEQILNKYLPPPKQNLIDTDYSNLRAYLQLWEGPGFLAYLNQDPKACREKFAQFFQAILPKLDRPIKTLNHPKPPQIVLVINSNTGVQAFLLNALYHWPQTEAQITIAYTEPALFISQLSRFRPDFTHVKISEEPAEALAQVQNLNADLIFYTEIHTDRLLQSFLGAYRLAPVQVSSWLSSGTSGLNTIDFFISSRLLEQNEQPERFYTEELILLGYLPGSLSLPVAPESPPKRSEYGLPETGNIYLCPHNMIKLHPDFDQVFEEILEQDDEAQLVLLARPNIPHLHQLLLQRFESKFPALMPRIWFMPAMDQQDFLGLLQQADVMLDPFYFGGGTTSFEALSLGIPIITWPGERLHGRITYAYYQLMNIFDCVAYNREEYINLALQLGTQKQKNQLIRQRIIQAVDILFHRKEDTHALAECLLNLTRRNMNNT